MSENGPTSFAAKLLYASPRVYAAYAAERLIERSSLAESDRATVFALWRTQLEGRVHDLAAALEVGEPQLFLSNLGWFLECSPGSRDHLEASLVVLAEVFEAELPAAAAQECRSYIDEGIDCLRLELPKSACTIDAATHPGQTALRYLGHVLEGDRLTAIETLEHALLDGTPLIDLYTGILAPAQEEIGRLWANGDLSVAQEHHATETTILAMAQFFRRRMATPRNGKTVVTAAATHDQHSLGLRMLADLFELDGWNSVFLGADVPVGDVATALVDFDADLLAVSATLSEHVIQIRRLIVHVRDDPETRSVPILVGGRAFRLADTLWERVGADGFASTPAEGITLAQRWVGL